MRMTMTRHSRPSSKQVRHLPRSYIPTVDVFTADKVPAQSDKKAREEMAKNAGKKGPMNTGQQGIKKSGKK
jgi:Translation machinery associated TMA7